MITLSKKAALCINNEVDDQEVFSAGLVSGQLSIPGGAGYPAHGFLVALLASPSGLLQLELSGIGVPVRSLDGAHLRSPVLCVPALDGSHWPGVGDSLLPADHAGSDRALQPHRQSGV